MCPVPELASFLHIETSMKITGLQNFKSNTVGEAPAQATGRATTSDGEALPTEEIADNDVTD